MDLVASQGFVYTILSKLDVKGGQWKLAAIINDGTGALEIDFCPQVRSQYFNDESIRLFGNSFLLLTLFVFFEWFHLFVSRTSSTLVEKNGQPSLVHL